MSDQPETPAPEVPQPSPAPAQPPAPHEGPLQHFQEWLHSHGHALEAGARDAATLTREAAPMVHGHAGQVLEVVARILAGASSEPALAALVPDAIRIGAGALQIAEAAL